METDRSYDGTIVKRLLDEIQYRKQEAIEILRFRYSDEIIMQLCDRFVKAPATSDLQAELSAEGYPPETFHAVIALCCLKYLEKNAPPTPDFHVTASDAANLILTGFNAMLTLVEAGWKPSEPFATTRLKQIRNQPGQRERDNSEKDEIEGWLNNYRDVKGIPPTTLGYFLEYLETKEVIVDSAMRTVEACNGTWRKSRSFRTIDGWLRDWKKNFVKNFPE